MITMKDFVETVNYRITEGDEFTWNCFGNHAYRLSSWDGDHDGVSISIVFDTQTQTVYQMEAHDFLHKRSYRWTNSDHINTYRDEATKWFNGDLTKDVAYDDVKFIELTESRDMLKKSQAMINHEPYDTRVEVPVDLEDSELFSLMKMAHKQDITLNQLVEKILTEVIKKHHSQLPEESSGFLATN